MVGPEERRKLMSSMYSEPIYPLVVVLKCLACLILLMVFVVGPLVYVATNDTSTADGRETEIASGAAGKPDSYVD